MSMRSMYSPPSRETWSSIFVDLVRVARTEVEDCGLWVGMYLVVRKIEERGTGVEATARPTTGGD